MHTVKTLIVGHRPIWHSPTRRSTVSRCVLLLYCHCNIELDQPLVFSFVQAQLAGANAEIDRLKVCAARAAHMHTVKNIDCRPQAHLADANAEIDRLKVCAARAENLLLLKTMPATGPVGGSECGDRPSQGV